jgi:hypothetical protein
LDPQPRPDPERRNADGKGAIVDWQFQLNPEGWTKLLFMSDAEERARRYRTIPDALLGEALHFGLTGDPALVNGLRGFFAWCLKHGMPVEIRRAVYRHAAGHQQCSKVISAHAYVPFVLRPRHWGLLHGRHRFCQHRPPDRWRSHEPRQGCHRSDRLPTRR